MREFSVPALAVPATRGGLADSVFDTAADDPGLVQLSRRGPDGRIGLARARGPARRAGIRGDELFDERQRRLMAAGAHHFCATMWYGAGEMRLARSHLRQSARALGWRNSAALCGRLWI